MRRTIFLPVKVFLLALFLMHFSVSFADNIAYKNTVNILTWWGYLSYPEIIQGAEKQCGVKISFDEYYSNDEFLRRWREQNSHYDIIVFSTTIYTGIKDEIKKIKHSTLWKQSDKYNPIIKQHYLQNKYPENIVYFIHSLTGFVYNTEVVSLSSTDSISTMFKKAGNKIVIIIDDPVEAIKLLTLGMKNINSPDNMLSSENFKKLYQHTNVYIGNDFDKIYKDQNFAFSFSWSGDGLKEIKKSNKKLNFLIHPQLSYISSDLLAQINENKDTECVSNFLTSEKTESFMQNNLYYFSPFTNIENVSDTNFRAIYTQFLNALPSLIWIDSVDSHELSSINRSWNLIKLDLATHKKEELSKTE